MITPPISQSQPHAFEYVGGVPHNKAPAHSPTEQIFSLRGVTSLNILCPAFPLLRVASSYHPDVQTPKSPCF